MENETKVNARIFLIWIADRRRETLSRPKHNRGFYWKTVMRHNILNARCMNKGETIPASRW